MILIKVHEHEPAAAYRIDTFPCTIGRSMTCTIRVDDLSVSARHAQIDAYDILDADEPPRRGYVLRDLGSTNGVISSDKRVTEVRLAQNETVFLGDVMVDLIVTEQLEPTRLNRRLPNDEALRAGSTAPQVGGIVAGSYIGLLGVAAAEQYSTFWPPDKFTELLTQALIPWLAVIGVSFAISLYCKLNAKRFQYHRVLGLMVLTYVAAKIVGLAVPTLAFNLHNAPLAGGLLHIGYAGIAFVFMWMLQRYAFHNPPRNQRLIVSLCTAAIAALAVEVLLTHRANSGDRDHMDEVGLPLRDLSTLRQTPEDLVFDAALGIAESDERRIHILEKIEMARGDD